MTKTEMTAEEREKQRKEHVRLTHRAWQRKNPDRVRAYYEKAKIKKAGKAHETGQQKQTRDTDLL